ncbi:hypothetical protein HanPSC8_Chr14g0626111 [Helianthus annuus]|nr:hypothetical protein HanIR_Chr14g0708321 [Helianthus annuus]KAJ0841061.1 hypothetical protein HanPSC8_Chr14g0626111 [Helianthus annuus]
MATISCCTVIKPHKTPNTPFPASVSSPTVSSCSLPIQLRLTHRCIISIPNSYPNSLLLHKRLPNLNKIRSSVAEEETAIPEQEESSSSDQGEVEPTVVVPVSRSDMLTMFFRAEGAMSEAAIPSVTSALEGTDDISDLKVQVLEGIASVELKKKTTVQATGVASNLVEIIQNSGFKLQTLNLSFDDDAN